MMIVHMLILKLVNEAKINDRKAATQLPSLALVVGEKLHLMSETVDREIDAG